MSFISLARTSSACVGLARSAVLTNTSSIVSAQAARRWSRNYSTPSNGNGDLVNLSPLSEFSSSLPSSVGSQPNYDPFIHVITLNRPEAKNAISRAFLNQLESHVSHLRSSPESRVVLLRSIVPNTFCAGADLKERAKMSQPEVNAFLLQLRNVFTGINKLPMPVIACLDGLAMGGGLEMALCADLRIAGPCATKLGLTETKLGIIPGAGGTSRMTRVVGVAKAKELVFSARLVNAEEANQIGFVDKIANKQDGHSGQEAFLAAIQMARSFAKNGPLAVRAAKMAIDRGNQMDNETALDFERQCYEPLLKSEDRLEGLRAFGEKRDPIYQGK